MFIGDQILIAIEDGVSSSLARRNAALLHSCLAVDATSRSLYPQIRSVRDIYTRCIREYLWLIEPMMGGGINLQDTVFDHIDVPGCKTVDFAELIYSHFRCNLAHGEEIPSNFSVTMNDDPDRSAWLSQFESVHMPDRIIWALISVAVFHGQRSILRRKETTILHLKNTNFRFQIDWEKRIKSKQFYHRMNTLA